ncbi:MAG: 30S ribosome-binding factor RbfA [Desulfurivibrionaceae bacterium]|nr:30S ribosome-binding factor RbfA [Desulfobulbales bacterium]MDT8334670.1 30S ribosome-binding factor RbfA [Desulfurivibrionaceae bacterium]
MAAKKSRSRFALPELDRKEGRRPARVGDSIKQEVALLLLRKIKDPRLYKVTITQVKVTPDLRRAWIYFSCLDENVEEVLAGLNSAKGFMRSHLARVMGMRYVPDLEFQHDLAGERMAEMDKIFREIAEEDDYGSQ